MSPARPLTHVAATALTLILALAPGLARAAAPAPERSFTEEEVDTLRRIYAKAEAAFEVGSYSAAAKSFEEAYALSGDPDLLFNVVVCHDRLGAFAEALETLDRYEAVAPASEAAQIADRRRSLEARLERSMNEADDPSDPPQAQTAPPRQPPEPPPRPEPAEEDRVMSPATWALLGVAVASIGAGTGLAIAAQNRRDQADCVTSSGSTLCTSRGASDAERSRRFALTADISFAVGGLAAVAALGILSSRAIRRKHNRTDVSTRAHAPLLGRATVGWSVAGRF